MMERSNHDLNSTLRKVSANFYQPDANLFSEEGLPVTITALSMLASARSTLNILEIFYWIFLLGGSHL